MRVCEIDTDATGPRAAAARRSIAALLAAAGLCVGGAAPAAGSRSTHPGEPSDTAASTPAEAVQALAAAGLKPFAAHYTAEWRSITVGTSTLELKADTDPGRYVYSWVITARGVFRVVYSNDVVQRSWFDLVDGKVRPHKYHAEDGSSTVDLDFDWNGGHAKGTSEKKPVDIALSDGMQDIMSIQVQVMASLQHGELAKDFRIIEKDQVKDFVYTQEGTDHLRTEMGFLDTVVVSSHRTGGNRILKMWFAPSLGYAPVQAERSRDGKLDFAMRLKSITSSAK